MNERGREKLTNNLLRRAVHNQLVTSCGWNHEIDKLSLDQRRELADHADDLHDKLKTRLEV